MTHLVNRLRFEIRCSEEQEAFEIRQNLAHLLHDIASDAIESVCSEYDAAGETIRIDTIELDLGAIPRHAFERELSFALRTRFESALLEHLRARGSEAVRQSARQSRFELFRHVAATGALPWWEASEAVDLDTIVLELAASSPGELRSFLLANIAQQALWARMAYQLGEAALRAVVKLFPRLENAEASILRRLEAGRGAAMRVASVARESGERPLERLALTITVHAAPDLFASSDVATLPERVVVEAIERFVARNGDVVADLVAPPPLAPAARPAVAAPEASATRPVQSRRESDAATGDLVERYVVRHAGLVLLAPFFGRLFEACALRRDDQWTHKRARYEAVHLLRYLCTGERNCAEHALILEKICCGVAIAEPIPRNLDLRPEVVAEADALLAAVIEHWKALRNTSVDGLRITFLTRDGVLTRSDDGWQLRVERKTLDVLLDRIPWGYSTVALPWRDDLLHVEW